MKFPILINKDECLIIGPGGRWYKGDYAINGCNLEVAAPPNMRLIMSLCGRMELTHTGSAAAVFAERMLDGRQFPLTWPLLQPVSTEEMQGVYRNLAENPNEQDASSATD